MLHTPSGGVWVLPGVVQSLGFFWICWKRLPLGLAEGRYVLGQVANARTRSGRAQPSGRTLDEVVFGTLLVCGGLSHPFCRSGVRMGMCHQLRT